jgi:nitrite reductase (NADH) small subunit/3-phenylpropionate/trans-cinnamate dioxygenase ferredoxin subunit
VIGIVGKTSDIMIQFRKIYTIFWSNRLFMFVKVATTDQVKPGRGFGTKLDKVFIGIYCIDGEYYAIDDVCPHMGGSLHHGFMNDCVVSCPLHMWEFDVKTGESVWPGSLNIPAYPVKIEGDDILVDIDSPQVQDI